MREARRIGKTTGILAAWAVAGWLAGAAAWADEPPAPPEAAEEPAAAAEEEAAEPAAPETAAEGDEGDDAALRIYDQVDVTGRASDLTGIADSASDGVTGKVDVDRRPILRPGELLETVPGVIITQHSGSGKANQYFLRGFNLDHGTDFRVTVDGMPVNMPSHGHGQGYTDLNFMIPELVSAVEYHKGAYSATEGDFSAAGSAHMEYVESLPKGILQAIPGTDGYRRLLAADSREAAGGSLLGALEVLRNDGPWERPDDFHKVNGVVRYSRGDVANGLNLTAMAYDGSWDSTDQVPERAVDDGQISRFGLIDPSDAGESYRYSLSLDLRRGEASRLDRLRAYAVAYELDLFSNFTYFLDDPVDGDQFEQTDRRTVLGFQMSREWLGSVGSREVESAAGFEARGDLIENGLFHTRERVRLGTTRQDDIQQISAAPFAEARVRWTPWLRTVTGLRLDGYWADVESDLAANSGRRDDLLLSPKVSLLFGPFRGAEIYANYGYGFHSNDARGATLRVDPGSGEPAGRVDPLVRAKTADLGLRAQPARGLQTTVSLFALELDSELLFVGDAGGTEATRPSRRTGVELATFWQALPWLAVDADFAVSRARFTDDDPAGDRIPGAVGRVLSAGISADELGRLFGSLRVRHFGPRDLVEDGSVRSRSSTLVNARLGYRLPAGLDLALEVFNLFDAEVSDIDYFYASRLPGEPDEGVEDVHFHPAEPRSARLVAAWRF